MRALTLLARQRLATGRAGRCGGTASEERTDRERHNNDA